MATSANIILSESHSYQSKNGKYVTKTRNLIFYRQCEGNPENTLPILQVFMNWIQEGNLRSNLNQCAGWLTILGAMEYNAIPKLLCFKEKLGYSELSKLRPPKVVKCGSFEPTTAIHGDIDYLYEVDVNFIKLTSKRVKYLEDGTQVFEDFETPTGKKIPSMGLLIR